MADLEAAFQRVRERLLPQALALDETDGLSLDFGSRRMNLRGSNTEPLLRLNVEARAGSHEVGVRVR